MLVLRRRIGEILLLTGGVEVEIMGISRSRVKLGIRAPKDVQIMRKEALPIADENQQASRLLVVREGDALPPALMRAMFLEQARTSHFAADKQFETI